MLQINNERQSSPKQLGAEFEFEQMDEWQKSELRPELFKIGDY